MAHAQTDSAPSINSGQTGSPQTNFPEGSLWRAVGDSRVYVISQERKRHLPTEAVFSSYGWTAADIRETDPETLFSIPDIRVVKLEASLAIYDIVSGTRIPLSSAEEFLAEGFSWDEVATVNRTELESYPLENATASGAILGATTPAAAPKEDSVLLQKIAAAREMLRAAPPLYPQEYFRAASSAALARGALGEAVQALQQGLQKLGYFPKTITPNGVFGPLTEQAVKKFQQAKNIQQLGRVGPQTAVALAKNGVALPAKGSAVRQWKDTVPANREVLLAAWHAGSDAVEPVRVMLETKRVKVGKTYRAVYTAASKTPGFTIRYKGGNGVNTQYTIASPAGWQVLANRFPIFDAASGKKGTFPPKEEVYVPYSDEFRTPDIVAAGKAYLDETVFRALSELRAKGVVSATGRGLVADLTDPEELENIVLIEHIDHEEFRRSPDKLGVVNRVFTTLGVNREGAYRFSGSAKGALGLAQFIRGTYKIIRTSYPQARLLEGFEEGMANHVNALQAAALYNDVTGATLESYVQKYLAPPREELALVLAEVRAAAYNGGAGRVKNALKKFGGQWQIAKNSRYSLRTETRLYLEKFKTVREILQAL